MNKKILIFVITISFTNTLTQREKRIFHGLGSNCILESEYSQKLCAKCIETGSNLLSLYSIKTQGQKGCKILKKEMEANPEIFKNGLYLIGMSQGGLIVRWIYKNCDIYLPKLPPIRNLIKRIVTLGTPNYGVDRLPDSWKAGQTSDNKFVSLFKTIANAKASMHTLKSYDSSYSPFCYINKVVNGEKFLSLLISELSEDDLSGLELMMNVTFDQEQMVNPIESSSFDTKMLDDGTFQDFSESSVYKKKLMKLDTLYDTGRFYNCKAKGGHLELNGYEWTFISLFIEDCEERNHTTYKNCLVNNLTMLYEKEDNPAEFGTVLKFLKCQGNFEEIVKINEEEQRKINNDDIQKILV